MIFYLVCTIKKIISYIVSFVKFYRILHINLFFIHFLSHNILLTRRDRRNTNSILWQLAYHNTDYPCLQNQLAIPVGRAAVCYTRFIVKKYFYVIIIMLTSVVINVEKKLLENKYGKAFRTKVIYLHQPHCLGDLWFLYFVWYL